jgi:hypothetical protein
MLKQLVAINVSTYEGVNFDQWGDSWISPSIRNWANLSNFFQGLFMVIFPLFLLPLIFP